MQRREILLALFVVLAGGALLDASFRTSARPSSHPAYALPEPVFFVHARPLRHVDPYTPAFVSTVEGDLSAGRYAELDAMATRFRKPGAAFVGGFPKLMVFYRILTAYQPCTCTPAVPATPFPLLLSRLEAWHRAVPSSPTPEIALAKLWLDAAWDARGESFIDKVSPDQWADTEHDLAELDAALIDPDPEIDPLPYFLRIEAGMVRGEDRDHLDAFYQRGTARFPWFYPYYSQRATVLEQRWYGDDGDLPAYLKALALSGPGDEGAIRYAFAASRIMATEEEDRFFSLDGLDFRSLVAGYQAREQEFGLEDRQWNELFRFSNLALDCKTGHVALVQIGSHRDPDIWGTRAYFDDNVKWFHQHSAY